MIKLDNEMAVLDGKKAKLELQLQTMINTYLAVKKFYYSVFQYLSN